MIYPVYCVRDNKVGFEPSLLVDMNDATAKRGFGFQVNNNASMRNYSPADYDLFKVGSFDTEGGSFIAITPEFICNGVNVLNEK